MGGMQGFGPVAPEADEPVFHEPWEGRIIALRRALGAIGKLPPTLRVAIESIPAVDYLRMGYYEIWYTAMVELLVALGLATREEIAAGRAAEGAVKYAEALPPADAGAFPFRVPAVMATAESEPRYAAGERVRARNLNPAGHTRLPRYVRGRTGVVVRLRGAQAFPDTDVYGRGGNPRTVYSVRFTARELWGDEASEQDSVYLDLWESYLEPA
jgi:nitrile hydratase